MKISPIARAVLFVAAVSSADAASPAWVGRSDAFAADVLRAIGRYSPEEAGRFGLSEYDSEITDLRSGFVKRATAELVRAEDGLRTDLATEKDPLVREDLEIMIHACGIRIEGLALNERYLATYVDAGELIFGGEFALLSDEVDPVRRPMALARLRKYTGLEAGTEPITRLAESLFEDSARDPNRIRPYRAEVEQNLSNTARYVAGIRKLYAKYAVADAGPALNALELQLKEYDAWVRRTVLPHARGDFRLPPELYAHNLKNIGLGISPEELIRKALLEYAEVQNELQTLAPLVARERGYPETDYREVVRHLKKEQLGPSEIEPYYHEVIAKIEETIRRERIATLPDRPMVMRLASEAESAAEPAPHMQPPRLINNKGERGEFVLPLGNPQAGANASDAYDDFTFKAAAWTLTAHEGRPGHELQFSAMVERGVSQARSIFAFNSVNVEGWALYSESEFKPYEPLDGQLIALQLRLLRAARAILDPMLNSGQISLERAHYVLTQDVVLSEAFAREELDRFTFRAPGQATSYFYGYSRLMELKAGAEVALGARFDRLAFNNFVVGQGLLPPDLLAKAVTEDFIPSQLK